jgi:hypothetical protein
MNRDEFCGLVSDLASFLRNQCCGPGANDRGASGLRLICRIRSVVAFDRGSIEGGSHLRAPGAGLHLWN